MDCGLHCWRDLEILFREGCDSIRFEDVVESRQKGGFKKEINVVKAKLVNRDYDAPMQTDEPDV